VRVDAYILDRHTPLGDRVIPTRSGHTLVELIVALALMALLTALVAPSFLASRVGVEGPSSVVARARRLAIVRGEGMRLALATNGEWRITPAAAGGVSVLDGRLTPPQSMLTLRISSTGLCLAVEGPAWDPIRCEPRDGGVR
jgi:prepilin-type N-terminal cleavage/methylation domain-containing protein